MLLFCCKWLFGKVMTQHGAIRFVTRQVQPMSRLQNLDIVSRERTTANILTCFMPITCTSIVTRTRQMHGHKGPFWSKGQSSLLPVVHHATCGGRNVILFKPVVVICEIAEER
jgi:hypothetical protein